jgi:hypothetical protein
MLHGAVTDTRAPRRTIAGMEVMVRLLFMGAVTCYLLGRIFTGEVAPIETVVYGLTAAFGLNFLVASWRDLWRGA